MYCHGNYDIMTSSVQVIAPLWHIATEKMADIMLEYLLVYV